MKIVALGAGGMGRYAGRTAASFDFVDEIVVGDLNEAAAKSFANSLGKKARPMRVDVTDPASLDIALAGADAVLNSVGPFYRLGPPVLEAAIRNRVHYLDLNDDWESTEAMLAFDDAARGAGITAIIGVGASPGITNLLAAAAARRLDTLTALYPGFDLDAAMPETRGPKPCAATVHGVHQLTGTIRVFDDGRFQDVRPMTPVPFEFPGLGPSHAWTMGHPEAITFPRSYPELRRCLVVMTMAPHNLMAMRVLRRLIDAGWLDIDRAADWIERLEGVGKHPVKGPTDYLRELAVERTRPLPPLFAVAHGTYQGRPAWVSAAVTSAPPVGMGGATGVPLAVGLAAARDILGKRPGVFAPEAILEPEAFFDRLAPLCDPVRGSSEDLMVLSESWQPSDLRTELARTMAEP
jgi:saccharopine dehydrogenase-like NADP-dependent oxidoreductase